MERYNILYIANFGNIIGGGEISLLSLLKGLNRERFHPIVVSPARGDLVDRLRKMGVGVRIIEMGTLRWPNPRAFLSAVTRFVRLLKKEKIDLIHTYGSRGTIYGGIAAKIARVPLIWHVRIAAAEWLDRFLVPLATKIIAISKAVKERFYWMGNRERKLSVIYNGLDLEEFVVSLNGNRIKREFGLSKEAPVVGIVGCLDRYKGHQYFLLAAKKVTKVISGTRFLIVGAGEYRKRLRNLTKELGLQKNVIFTGHRRDIPLLLEVMDVFVLSSVSEGFGRSAAEAMACQRPVVATKVGGLPEIVEDGVTGILVPPQDPTALSRAIISLLKDRKKAQKMGLAGRKRVEKMFTIEGNVRKTEEVYEELLKRR